jgi:hypothetical protein
MTKLDVEDHCKCGAIFKAFGESFSVAFRHGSWLDAHRVCRNKDMPYTEEELKEKLKERENAQE